MSAEDIMSDVTPGAGCFAGAGADERVVAVGAGAFVTVLALGEGAATGGALTFDRAGGLASAPVAMYGWPAGVIAGSWFASVAPD